VSITSLVAAVDDVNVLVVVGISSPLVVVVGLFSDMSKVFILPLYISW
jgi:hypothetical protein